MKIKRTKNAIRNVSAGIVLRACELIMPFLVRTVMIYNMGIEYAGLNGLFNSILQVLNMAELGVGSAMVFSMYRPIAEDDAPQICALMAMYRRYYRIIGVVVGCIGLLLLPYVPNLIEKGVPEGVRVHTLYLLYLGSTVLSYWLFAYKNALLTAHQRNDLVSKVRTGVLCVQYTLQILSIIVWKNYYIFLIIALTGQALINVITAWVAHKKYPQYSAGGKLDKKTVSEINHRIADLFAVKFGNVIVSCADTIVISAFLGLTALAIYQNYFTIITAVTGTISVLYNASLAGIGNSILVETQEKNYLDFRKFTFLVCWITGFCSSCFLCLYQPFMEIWMGSEYLLEMNAVVCLCVYFYVYEMSRLFDTYKDAAGMWHKDRLRLLMTSLINLGLNLLMVESLGIYGVLLSTILSMLLVGLPWLIKNLFDEVFGKQYMLSFVGQILRYAMVSILGCMLAYGICRCIPLTGWPAILVRGVICCIVPNVLFFVVYRKKAEFAYYRSILETEIKRIAKRKNGSGGAL